MEQQNIINRLDKIELVLKNIQANMSDAIASDEEKILLDESVEHEKKGKLVSLEAIRNVRNKV
jgi:hypothetical protein